MKEASGEWIRIGVWLLLISAIGYLFLDDQVSDWIEHLLGLR